MQKRASMKRICTQQGHLQYFKFQTFELYLSYFLTFEQYGWIYAKKEKKFQCKKSRHLVWAQKSILIKPHLLNLFWNSHCELLFGWWPDTVAGANRPKKKRSCITIQISHLKKKRWQRNMKWKENLKVQKLNTQEWCL